MRGYILSAVMAQLLKEIEDVSVCFTKTKLGNLIIDYNPLIYIKYISRHTSCEDYNAFQITVICIEYILDYYLRGIAMNSTKHAIFLTFSLLISSAAQANFISNDSINGVSLLSGNFDVRQCASDDVPSGSLTIVSELLSEYSIGDNMNGSEIVGYRSAVYCDPGSLRIHSAAGNLDTGDFLFRSNSRVIDGVWEGEAQVSWYQQDIRSAPEPSTLLLMSLGLVGIGLSSYKKRDKH
jgi:hypothetical protein